jgi:hypothetical protein
MMMMMMMRRGGGRRDDDNAVAGIAVIDLSNHTAQALVVVVLQQGKRFQP